MTLRGDLSKAADSLFSSFVSVMYPASYGQYSTGAYDPTTGKVGGGYGDLPCTVSLQSWAQSQITGEVVKVGDRKALVRGSELGFEPSSDDRITIDSKVWNVMGYSTDPAGIVYTLHIRAAQ